MLLQKLLVQVEEEIAEVEQTKSKDSSRGVTALINLSYFSQGVNLPTLCVLFVLFEGNCCMQSVLVS